MKGPGAAERVGAGRRLFKVTFYGMHEGGLLSGRVRTHQNGKVAGWEQAELSQL